MRTEQIKRMLEDLTPDELDELREWTCGSYWGNKTTIDLIDEERARRAGGAVEKPLSGECH
jgi:hypothetical protein